MPRESDSSWLPKEMPMTWEMQATLAFIAMVKALAGGDDSGAKKAMEVLDLLGLPQRPDCSQITYAKGVYRDAR